MKTKLHFIAKTMLLLFTICNLQLVFSQAPQKMSYQAVIRNSSGALVTSTSVGMRISILQNSVSGISVYTETQTASTNINGLVSIEIGTGTVVSGIFSTINWGVGTYYIKTETDPTGGVAYSIVGINQLMSVPYALFAASGNSGPAGPTGQEGPIGKSVSLRTNPEPVGNNCPAGGNKIQFGTDTNGNNILDDSEINADLTKYICNGSTGLNSVMRTVPELAGANCGTGGTRIQGGTDTNGNNILDDSEINTDLTKYVCSGSTGLNSVMRTVPELAGANCATGGTRIQGGTDTNGNNILDDSEINPELTKYVCNGTQGTAGVNISLRNNVEPPGNNCPAGGNKIQFGLDTNGNNTLDDSEINAALTQYVCNGTQNPAGNSVGDMQYWNGSSWITLPAGTAGQTLRVNTSGIPQWQN
jgi:hypothetical protein